MCASTSSQQHSNACRRRRHCCHRWKCLKKTKARILFTEARRHTNTHYYWLDSFIRLLCHCRWHCRSIKIVWMAWAGETIGGSGCCRSNNHKIETKKKNQQNRCHAIALSDCALSFDEEFRKLRYTNVTLLLLHHQHYPLYIKVEHNFHCNCHVPMPYPSISPRPNHIPPKSFDELVHCWLKIVLFCIEFPRIESLCCTQFVVTLRWDGALIR